VKSQRVADIKVGSIVLLGDDSMGVLMPAYPHKPRAVQVGRGNFVEFPNDQRKLRVLHPMIDVAVLWLRAFSPDWTD